MHELEIAQKVRYVYSNLFVIFAKYSKSATLDSHSVTVEDSVILVPYAMSTGKWWSHRSVGNRVSVDTAFPRPILIFIENSYEQFYSYLRSFLLVSLWLLYIRHMFSV